MGEAIFLDDLQAAVHEAFSEGIEPEAILLNPDTRIHFSDPALGLDPLGAAELDALDGLPIVLDPTVRVGVVEIRERTRPVDPGPPAPGDPQGRGL